MKGSQKQFTWYLMLKPLDPWNVAPGNEERKNESINNSFCLANHHSENILNGIPPVHEREKQHRT